MKGGKTKGKGLQREGMFKAHNEKVVQLGSWREASVAAAQGARDAEKPAGDRVGCRRTQGVH